jgi:hypothetical protein
MKGTKESAMLVRNVEDQLNRLLTQLSDLEEMESEMDKAEYEASKKDTIEQLKEFEETLSKLVSGDVTLVSELDTMRNAVHAYVSGACRDPNVTRMFATKSTTGLRNKLASLEQDLKLNRIKQDAFSSLAVDIVAALERLGEPLSLKESELLENARRNMSSYTVAASGYDDITAERVLDTNK